jgi:hypothetical protein
MKKIRQLSLSFESYFTAWNGYRSDLSIQISDFLFWTDQKTCTTISNTENKSENMLLTTSFSSTFMIHTLGNHLDNICLYQQ